MAEPTQPLLNDSNSSPPRSLDDTIESYIGSFGWAQFLQATLVSFSGVFDAQQTFISVFTDFEPKWHCTESFCHDSISNICILPKTSWSWDFPPHVSVISEWGLQCSGSFVKGLPESSFFVGCLIGGLILSTLADSSLGRKNMLFLSCLLMSISTMLTVFSPNIWVYAFLRFVNGFGRATIGTCALVLSTELVGKRWRGRVGIMSFFGFMLGFLSLPAMAYMNRGNSWRILYIWTSVPTIIYCVLVRYFVCESPRWLFVRGRREEAISILKRVASIPMSDGTMSFSSLPTEEEDEKPSVNIYAAMKVLVEKRWALRRLTAVMAVAFGIGLVYYGMPLALSNLDFNVYMSAAFNALMDLPANLITLFLVDKLSRRNALIGFTALGGVSSVLIFALPNMRIGSHGTLQLVLELISYFCACSAFNIEMIYTIELFPTCVRNSAIAMTRQALVLGGVFSPIMVAAGRKNGFWSFGLFGLAIGLLGLFAVALPETRGSDLCDTMDEEECKDRQECAGDRFAGLFLPDSALSGGLPFTPCSALPSTTVFMLQTHGSTSQSRIPMGLLLTSQIHLHLSLAVFLGSPWCQHLVQVSSSSPSLLSTLHLKPTFLLGGNLALRMEAAGFLAIGPLDLLFSGDSPYRLSPPPFTSTHKPSPPPSPSVLVLKHLLHLRESDSFCHATPPHVSSTPVDRRSPAFLLSPNQNRSFTWRYIELDNPTYRRRCSVHFELSHKVMRLGLVDPTVLDDLCNGFRFDGIPRCGLGINVTQSDYLSSFWHCHEACFDAFEFFSEFAVNLS
ncbi:hypothetical protein HID58_047777 [Brassica napus]|uniref:Major facilitator superfamily (MFS) profile domain-containing protein n=1 Tax=Brassica napus TaxID=3708 RepID=A0ABQ8B086_BRANA|nr:hypothetical protein HID58_047777 [Brassica napus]